MINEIHTPLGSWHVGGSGHISDQTSVRKFFNEFKQKVNIKMISSENFNDTRWLLMNSNDKNVCYKPMNEYIQYKEATKIFREYLGKWIQEGLIKDTNEFSLSDNYEELFLTKFPKLNRDFILSFKKHKPLFIFNCIYHSHTNVN